MAYIWEQKSTDTYLISGVWHNYHGEVTHYAVHEFLNPGVSGRSRMTKKEVVAMIEEGKVFFVFGWDYKDGRFKKGKRIYCSNGFKGAYLHHEPQEKHSKDMRHLIRVSWFEVY